MKIKIPLILSGVLFIVGCTKSAPELLDQAEKSLNENQVELAINDLESLLKEYPRDSLAALAQYKLATIFKIGKMIHIQPLNHYKKRSPIIRAQFRLTMLRKSLKPFLNGSLINQKYYENRN